MIRIARLRVRLWHRLERCAERHLIAAYDDQVAREAKGILR